MRLSSSSSSYYRLVAVFGLTIGLLLTTVLSTSVARAEQVNAESERVATESSATGKRQPTALSRFTEKWETFNSDLQERGGTFKAFYTLDSSYNMRGGIRQRGTYRGRLDLTLLLNLKPLIGLEDGSLFVNYHLQSGRNAQHDIGSLQGLSNLDANGRSQIFELWYQQWLFNKKLRIKIGKVEAKQEFAWLSTSAEFLNGSMEFSPTIFVLPAYPDSAMGLNVFVYPTEHLYAGFGLYDGSASRGVHTGVHGPQTLAYGKLFFVGEVGGQWTLGQSRLPGRLGLGGWGHNGTFDRFRGGRQQGTAGAYFVADQALWRENPHTDGDEQGIGMYAQYGYADAAVSNIAHHVGFGLTWTGLFPGRDEEILGVGASFARLSEQTQFKRTLETYFELFYKMALSPNISLKPDLQYVINPSGGAVRNAFISSVRCEMRFN